MAKDLRIVREKLKELLEKPTENILSYESGYNRGLEVGFSNGYHAALCVIKAKASKKDAESILKLIAKTVDERESICRLHQEEMQQPLKDPFVMRNHPYGIRFI